MNQLRNFSIFITVLFALVGSCFLSTAAHGNILHLEIGAANYSGKTSDKRFYVLEQTMINLVERFGDKGIIYLNDIDIQGLHEAISFAKTWLNKKSYHNIHLIPLPGDFKNLHIPRVKTANMTNPDQRQLPGLKFGKEVSTITVAALEHVALRSKTGLRISTYFWGDEHEGMEILDSLLKSSQLFRSSKKGLPYYYDDGRHSSEVPGSSKRPATRVYYLISRPNIPQIKPCVTIFERLGPIDTSFYL